MVVRRRHTRKTDRELAGATVQRSVRLPTSQVTAVQEALDRGVPDVHNLTDALTDALWLWLYEQSKVLATPVNTTLAQEPALEATRPVSTDLPRPDSNGRPAWKDVDPALLEDS